MCVHLLNFFLFSFFTSFLLTHTFPIRLANYYQRIVKWAEDNNGKEKKIKEKIYGRRPLLAGALLRYCIAMVKHRLLPSDRLSQQEGERKMGERCSLLSPREMGQENETAETVELVAVCTSTRSHYHHRQLQLHFYFVLLHSFFLQVN